MLITPFNSETCPLLFGFQYLLFFMEADVLNLVIISNRIKSRKLGGTKESQHPPTNHCISSLLTFCIIIVCLER